MSEVELSDKQQAAVDEICGRIDDDEMCITLGGYAGTGKTTVIRELSRIYPSYAVVAFTGKAAHVLRTKGIDAARTIHSTIYHPEEVTVAVTDPETKKTKYVQQIIWTLREESLFESEESPICGFIVDEASMISKSLYDDLRSFGLPCIFVGDHGQLPPIEGVFNIMERPQITLETIHRNAGEIARFAEWLRKGRRASSFGTRDDTVRLVKLHDVNEQMLLDADQIICAFNKARIELNRKIRLYLKRDVAIEPGDRLICLRNHKESGLFNGLQGQVEEASKVLASKDRDYHYAIDLAVSHEPWVYPGIRIDPEQLGNEKTAWGNDELHPFDYAWAITCHKAQGSEWPHVLVYEQFCKLWNHARWAYTAASRARERLTWVLPRNVA